ncbi:MAG: hypothetical protein JO007_01240 [Alphaproteobacteria bacterium]|nr:hypothetical protein [Alphaproteobacteria bacterium]
MNSWADQLIRVCLAVLFLTLTISVSQTAAPLLPVCTWPFESNGQGFTNVATPDTNATYWVMPVDTSHWKTVIIHGTYPKARFFNFSTNAANGFPIGSIYDAEIAPDANSWNPFAAPAGSGAEEYTVNIGASAGRGTNFLHAGGGFAFVVYRVYLANPGFDRTGGVGLPAVSLEDFSGRITTLQPCPFAAAETSLANLILLLESNEFTDAAKFLGNILALAHQSPLGTCKPTQAGPSLVAFSPTVPGGDFFPNPQTIYFQTPNLCYQQNRVLVLRGRAAVYPATYTSPPGSVFQPAFDDQIQLRYWSMCNNVGVIPYPAVACHADAMTNLDADQFHTYVVSNDPAPPPWLPAGTTWLPWGPTSLPITLIFRNILPENGFTPAGNYQPTGVFCNEATLISQGWQGCFAAVGIMP